MNGCILWAQGAGPAGGQCAAAGSAAGAAAPHDCPTGAAHSCSENCSFAGTVCTFVLLFCHCVLHAAAQPTSMSCHAVTNENQGHLGVQAFVPNSACPVLPCRRSSTPPQRRACSAAANCCPGARNVSASACRPLPLGDRGQGLLQPACLCVAGTLMTALSSRSAAPVCSGPSACAAVLKCLLGPVNAHPECTMTGASLI